MTTTSSLSRVSLKSMGWDQVIVEIDGKHVCVTSKDWSEKIKDGLEIVLKTNDSFKNVSIKEKP